MDVLRVASFFLHHHLGASFGIYSFVNIFAGSTSALSTPPSLRILIKLPQPAASIFPIPFWAVRLLITRSLRLTSQPRFANSGSTFTLGSQSTTILTASGMLSCAHFIPRTVAARKRRAESWCFSSQLLLVNMAWPYSGAASVENGRK